MFTKIYKEKYTLHYLRVAKLIVAGNAFKCRLYNLVYVSLENIFTNKWRKVYKVN